MTGNIAKTWKLALKSGCGLSLLLALGGCAATGTPGNLQTSRPLDRQDLNQKAELDYATHAIAGNLGRRSLFDAAVIISDLANKGDPIAQGLIGMGEIYGTSPLFAKNPQEGVAWLRKAADRGWVQANVELAGAYSAGLGVERDPAKAKDLLEAAARQGNLDAYEILGRFYYDGFGVAKDEKTGVSLSFKAADKGRPGAMFLLGNAYQDGRGIEADKLLAYVWFGEAAKRSYVQNIRNQAAKARDGAALALRPEELAFGNRLIDTWKPGQNMADLRQQMSSSDTAPGQGPAVATQGTQAEAAPSSAAQAATNVPVVYRSVISTIDVAEDGSSVTTTHLEIQPRNESAAHNFGQYPVIYDSQMESLEVVDAYTLKPDGRKLDTDLKTIQEQLVPGNARLPMFDQQRQKVVILRDLQPGDTAVLTYRTRTKTDFPGRYSLALSFDRSWAVIDDKLTVSFPPGFTPHVEEHGVTSTRKEVNGRHVIEWTFSNPHPVVEEKFAVSPLDRNPRLFLSNYKDYEDFGRTYAELVKNVVTVTPEVRKLADEITSGVTDRRRQAELIHDWVSHHIRYVQIRLGEVGGMMPHDVSTIIANGYGDCKDHSVLYAALLKSKGIESELVLINYGNGYGMPTTPSYGLFNHMINWLPEFKTYDDTTLEVAPFGMLGFGEYGKPTVHASLSAPRVSRTPEAPADEALTLVKTTARMDSHGSLEGETEVTASGPFAIELRQRALAIQSQGKEQAAKNFMTMNRLDGYGAFDFASPYDPGKEYRVTGHFKFNQRQDWIMGNSFNMSYGMNVGWRPGEDLLGPLDLLDSNGNEASPCLKGRQVAELALELPAGKKLRELPKDFVNETPSARYQTSWSLDGHTVKLRRELVSKVDRALCVGDPRRQTARLQNDIRLDSYATISLVDE